MRALIVLLLIPALAQAQLPPIKLTIDPAPEAKPALRYELLPSARDRVAGNAVLHYLKAYAAKPGEERDPAKRKEEYDTVIKWEEATVEQLPKREVAEYLKRFQPLFRELEYGARCKNCEWAGAPVSGSDAIANVVGNVQSYRELARWLSLRFKLELAENRFDDALRTIQTGLQFGKHVTEGPTMIQMLVGNAVTAIFLGKLETLIGHPGSPNMYWALSTLPKPLLDPRPGLDGEDQLNESFFPGLAELQKSAVSPERALELVAKSLSVFQGMPENDGIAATAQKFAVTAAAELRQADARKEFILRGRDPKIVAAMPAVQVVFLNSFARYRDIADDYRKWFLLGGPDASAGVEKIVERLKKTKADAKDDTILQVFLNILPAMEKTFYALARTERKIAQLRAFEAIRMHAALEGQLPRELSEIKKIPVPSDPSTGKPFEYTTTEGGFLLISPEAKGASHMTMRYEVTLRAKK